MSNKKSLVALCGPSGVGKGTLKRKIGEAAHERGVEFFEPVIVTTRRSRKDDGTSRRAGVSKRVFMSLVESGEVVLPHQPFRHEDSPWYGFDSDSVSRGPILTEVHSSLTRPFCRLFESPWRSMVVGLVASRATLVRNLAERQGFEGGDDLDMRVAAAEAEIDEIRDAHVLGDITEVAVFDTEVRGQSTKIIIERALDHIGLGHE